MRMPPAGSKQPNKNSYAITYIGSIKSYGIKFLIASSAEADSQLSIIYV
jgi:hypothetical protein